MTYAVPLYEEAYFLDLPHVFPRSAEAYLEVQKVMSAGIKTFGLMLQRYSVSHRLHSAGTNLPFGDIAYIRIAFYLGTVLATPVRGVPAFQLITEPTTIVDIDSHSRFSGNEGGSIPVDSKLRSVLEFFAQFKNPTVYNYSDIPLSKIKSSLALVANTPYSLDEDTINVALVNSILMFVKNYSLLFLDDIDTTISYKRYDFFDHFLDGTLEEVFSAWLDNEAVTTAITSLQQLGKLKASDLSYRTTGMSLSVEFYQRILDESFSILFSQTEIIDNWHKSKERFARDRKIYALTHLAKTESHTTGDTDLSLTVGFHEGKVIMKQSDVDNFLKNFNTRYHQFLPLWGKFISTFFTTSSGYLLPASSARVTVKDGKPHIYHLTWQNPYLRNSHLYTLESGRAIRIADLDTNKVSTSYEDEYEVISYRGTYNLCSPKFIELMKQYAKQQYVRCSNLDTDEYLVIRSDQVLVVHPPAGVAADLFIVDRPKTVPGKSFVTFSTNVNELSMLELMFYIRHEDVGDAEAIYKKRLALIGSEYVMGKTTYVADMKILSVSILSEAMLYATFARITSDALVRAAKIKLKLPTPHTEIKRIIKMKKLQVFEFPVDPLNVSDHWWEQAPQVSSLEDHWYGDERFALSKNLYGDVFGNCITGRVSVDIGIDINFGDFNIVDEDPIFYSLLYAPKAAAPRQRITMVTLGKHTQYDFEEAELSGSDSLTLIINILMSTYFDCAEGSAIPDVVVSVCVGIVKFLNHINPNGVVRDSQTIGSSVTWQKMADALKPIIKTPAKSRNEKVLSKFCKVVEDLFGDERSLWGEAGYKIEVSTLGNVYLLLLDRHTGVVRSIGGFVTQAQSVSASVCLPGLFNTSPVEALLLNRINRRIQGVLASQTKIATTEIKTVSK